VVQHVVVTAVRLYYDFRGHVTIVHLPSADECLHAPVTFTALLMAACLRAAMKCCLMSNTYAKLRMERQLLLRMMVAAGADKAEMTIIFQSSAQSPKYEALKRLSLAFEV
jgi:hypothetical protein